MSTATALQRRKLEVVRGDGSTVVIPAPARRVQETLTNLVNNGPRGVSSLHNPGLRLSHYIFVLRTKYGFPIHMEKVAQPGGVGWYGRYTLRERVELRSLDEKRPTTAPAVSVLNPNSELVGMGGLDA